MRLLALTMDDYHSMTEDHVDLARIVLTMVHDLGKDYDIVMATEDLEDPSDGPFRFMFAGTDLSILIDFDGVYVEEYDDNLEEDLRLKEFNVGEVGKATHWLLTQVS